MPGASKLRMLLRSLAAVTLAATFLYAPAPGPRAVDPQIAAAVAAVSAARLRTTDTRLVAFGTRNLFSEQSSDPHRGVFAARDWLVGQYRAIGRANGGRLTVALDTYEQAKTDRTPRAVQVSSVIATLPGDDPKRGVIVISSHYDSRNSDGNDATLDAPGADDNGSGTSAVVEAARVLAPLHFPATIVFACFDGEEQGLFGSAHYAHVLHEAGTVVEANLNNDIIGSSVAQNGTPRSADARGPYDVRLFSESLPAGAKPARVNALGSENDSPARELARAVREVDAVYVPSVRINLIYRSDRFLRGGDQESFAAEGFPAVRFVEAFENWDHQHQTIRTEGGVVYGDLLGFMDFDYLALVTQSNVAALASLARAPAAPKPLMLNRDLGHDTTLRWDAVPSAASYEVLWRATNESLWTHAKAVTSPGDQRVITDTLTGISKDDWIFGVRALDSAGHTSVAAYPEPIR